MRVAVVQSSFLPWLGYFDLIKSVDHFIFLEEVQYTNRDWRNRNKIKTPNGAMWISVPVQKGIGTKQSIREVKTMDSPWSTRIIETMRRNYARAPFFDEVMRMMSGRLCQSEGGSLSKLNRGLIQDFCAYLKISTATSDDSNTKGNIDPSVRLADLVKSVGGSTYISGPTAKHYLEEKPFWEREIDVSFVEYPEYYGNYRQQWGEFEPNLSVCDALFNLGPETKNWLSGKL